SSEPRADSSIFLHQADEDVLERALCRLEILEANAGVVELLQQPREPRAVTVGIVGIRELAAVGRALERVARQRSGNLGQRLLQLQRQLFAAELAHQVDLVLDEDQL